MSENTAQECNIQPYCLLKHQIIENAEHCGGEPEQADTGTPLYAVP